MSISILSWICSFFVSRVSTVSIRSLIVRRCWVSIPFTIISLVFVIVFIFVSIKIMVIILTLLRAFVIVLHSCFIVSSSHNSVALSFFFALLPFGLLLTAILRHNKILLFKFLVQYSFYAFVARPSNIIRVVRVINISLEVSTFLKELLGYFWEIGVECFIWGIDFFPLFALRFSASPSLRYVRLGFNSLGLLSGLLLFKILVILLELFQVFFGLEQR